MFNLTSRALRAAAIIVLAATAAACDSPTEILNPVRDTGCERVYVGFAFIECDPAQSIAWVSAEKERTWIRVLIEHQPEVYIRPLVNINPDQSHWIGVVGERRGESLSVRKASPPNEAFGTFTFTQMPPVGGIYESVMDLYAITGTVVVETPKGERSEIRTTGQASIYLPKGTRLVAP